MSDSTTAHCELQSLCEGLFQDLAWIGPCQVIEATDIDSAARSLLVHADHMTATLSDHYGEPVALHVHQHEEDGSVYRRKIVLTVEGGARVVEFGVVRINLAMVDDDVRRAILQRETPLGEILNKHNVLVRVEPKWFVRFPKNSPVAQMFRPTPSSEVFGRLGAIYCDDKPVIELLEVVNP